jgi:hypothetical protein
MITVKEILKKNSCTVIFVISFITTDLYLQYMKVKDSKVCDTKKNSYEKYAYSTGAHFSPIVAKHTSGNHTATLMSIMLYVHCLSSAVHLTLFYLCNTNTTRYIFSIQAKDLQFITSTKFMYINKTEKNP